MALSKLIIHDLYYTHTKIKLLWSWKISLANKTQSQLNIEMKLYDNFSSHIDTNQPSQLLVGFQEQDAWFHQMPMKQEAISDLYSTIKMKNILTKKT